MIPYVSEGDYCFYIDQIKSIKAQLEAQHCAKLSRSTNYNHSSGGVVIKLMCKMNAQRHEKCPFLVQFFEYEKGYVMKQKNLKHLEICSLDNQEAFYAKNRLILDSYRAEIVKIIRADPLARPREILTALIQNLDLNPNFLTQGLEGDKHFERRMKKKFDNTILEIRNQMGIQVPKQNGQNSKVKDRSKKKNFKIEEDQIKQQSNHKDGKAKINTKQKITHNIHPSHSHKLFNDHNYHPQPIQIVNNLQYFIHPIVELVPDQGKGSLTIHLINRSKDKVIELPKMTKRVSKNTSNFNKEPHQINEKDL